MLKAVRATLAHYWPIFRSGGPVALGQAVRLAYLDRKTQKVYDLIDQEEALHDRMMAELRYRLNHIAGKKQAVAVAQSHFIRYVANTNSQGGRS